MHDKNVENKKVSCCVTRCTQGRIPVTARTIIALFIGLLFGTAVCRADSNTEEWIYTFTKGDNLWNITEKYLVGMEYWRKLQKLNDVTRPKQMPPGTRIRIPEHWLKIEAAEARVKDSLGSNTYIPEGDTKGLQLTEDTLLRAGDEVVIREGGNALLEFADGSLLQLADSTQLLLQRVIRIADTGKADTRTLLKNGRAEIKVKTGGTRFEIRTPSASTAVRGTDFRTRVEPEDNNLSRVEAIKGVVGVSGSGRTRELKAGFGTSIKRGEPPRPPVKLLPAPSINQPQVYSRVFPVTFKWTPVTGAAAYRVQINRVDGRNTGMLDTIIEGPVYSTNALKDANYILKVRAIDVNGLEGLDGTLAFELDAQPQPPAVISPVNNQVVRTRLPHFEWSQPLNADGFRFQLSRDPEFSRIVADIKGYTGTHYSPDKLEPGAYFWRLASMNTGEEGPPSQPFEFILRPLPEAPETTVEEGDKELIVRWSPARKGQSYRLQVAEDEDYGNLLVDEELDRPEWRMERPQVPVFFHVQIIDVDGFRGAWSLSQKVFPPPQPWYYSVIPVAVIVLFAL